MEIAFFFFFNLTGTMRTNPIPLDFFKFYLPIFITPHELNGLLCFIIAACLTPYITRAMSKTHSSSQIIAKGLTK